MRHDGNCGGAVNYEPNSFDGPAEDHKCIEPPLKVDGDADRYNHRDGNDDYRQPEDLFRLMTPEQQQRLIGNLVRAMTPLPKEGQLRQIGHFLKAARAYGEGVARGLGIDVAELEAPRCRRNVCEPRRTAPVCRSPPAAASFLHRH